MAGSGEYGDELSDSVKIENLCLADLASSFPRRAVLQSDSRLKFNYLVCLLVGWLFS